jgi:hypothetical protein
MDRCLNEEEIPQREETHLLGETPPQEMEKCLGKPQGNNSPRLASLPHSPTTRAASFSVIIALFTRNAKLLLRPGTLLSVTTALWKRNAKLSIVSAKMSRESQSSEI